MIILRPSLRLGVLGVADGAALTVLAPDWARLATRATHVQSWVATEGADQVVGTLAGAALWLCAGWLAVGLAATLLSAAPGWLGGAGRRLTQLVLPVAIRRLLIGAAGLSLSLTVGAPLASAAATSTATTSPTAPTAPTWPTSATSTGPGPTSTAPAWPTTRATPTSTAPPAVAQTPTTYVVVPGDCLWDLAAAQLTNPTPEQVAAQVQFWYAANRSTIGPDPSLLRPGERLLAPAARVPNP